MEVRAMTQWIELLATQAWSLEFEFQHPQKSRCIMNIYRAPHSCAYTCSFLLNHPASLDWTASSPVTLPLWVLVLFHPAFEMESPLCYPGFSHSLHQMGAVSHLPSNLLLISSLQLRFYSWRLLWKKRCTLNYQSFEYGARESTCCSYSSPL